MFAYGEENGEIQLREAEMSRTLIALKTLDTPVGNTSWWVTLNEMSW